MPCRPQCLAGDAPVEFPHVRPALHAVAIPLLTLSGSNTPLESMPVALQYIMLLSPSTHFVSFAQSAILYRGAGLGVVWPEFVATVVAALLVLGVARLRFRRMTAQAVG